MTCVSLCASNAYSALLSCKMPEHPAKMLKHLSCMQVRKPDGTPPDMERKADILVFEVRKCTIAAWCYAECECAVSMLTSFCCMLLWRPASI